MSGVADDSTSFGPAWEGWESYRLFAESVKTDLRYVRRTAENGCLNEVLATSGPRRLIISPGQHVYWRARLGCAHEEVTDKDGDLHVSWPENRPYAQADMKPVSIGRVKEGLTRAVFLTFI
jgi:hypothetical protein